MTTAHFTVIPRLGKLRAGPYVEALVATCMGLSEVLNPSFWSTPMNIDEDPQRSVRTTKWGDARVPVFDWLFWGLHMHGCVGVDLHMQVLDVRITRLWCDFFSWLSMVAFG